jgi:hypothetical protein
VQEEREDVGLRQREERRRHQADGREAERLCKTAELDRDLRAQIGDVGDHRERRGEFGDGSERDFAFVGEKCGNSPVLPRPSTPAMPALFSNARCVASAARSRRPAESMGSHWAE